MRPMIPLRSVLLSAGLVAYCATAMAQPPESDDALLAELVALERSALDRWVKLDPDGYLDLFATDVTYFDPTTERRMSGLEELRARLAPVRNMKPPFSDPRYELIAPKVQRRGDVALLTFNLINYGKLSDGVERELARWNSTEVYSRIDGNWKIIHSHWSSTQPQQKPPVP